jgi:hypothetical protein
MKCYEILPGAPSKYSHNFQSIYKKIIFLFPFSPDNFNLGRYVSPFLQATKALREGRGIALFF